MNLLEKFGIQLMIRMIDNNYFSGTDFEDMIAGLTWPCTLPPCWSVEWDGPSACADTPPAE